jgi:hypothetical protein
MTQSAKPSSDPLDGYRRTPDEYAELESELRAFRQIAANEVNVENLRSVILKDEIKNELRNGSSTFARLVSHAVAVYEVAQSEWVAEDRTDTDKARAAHANARAARLVMDWVATQIETGEQAQRELEVEATYGQDD